MASKPANTIIIEAQQAAIDANHRTTSTIYINHLESTLQEMNRDMSTMAECIRALGEHVDDLDAELRRTRECNYCGSQT